MRQRVMTLGVALIGIATTVFFAVATQSSAAAPPTSESIVQIGFDIAPVPLNLTGKNRALVGTGSYLVNAVGGCNDCHTWRPSPFPPNFGSNYEPGGDPFSGQPEQIYTEGYLAGGRPFGPFTSRNLTPDAAGQVADGYLTFRQIIRHGFDTEGITPVTSGHAMARVPQHVRERSQGDLRVSDQHSVRRGHAWRAGERHPSLRH